MTQEAQAEQFEITPEQLLAVLNQRTATYGLLSRLYLKEIDQALLDELHATKYRRFTGNEDVDEGHRLIATYLSGMWENTLTELAVDYMRILFGHGYDSHSAAYPFESVYTSEKRLLMEDARGEVLALYRAAGLAKRPDWKESEDHIAIELEYMKVLAERTAAAFEAGNEEEAVALLKCQKNFLDDHLLTWEELFCNEVKNRAKTKFYEGVAFLTDGFLKNDRNVVADLLDD